MFFVDGTPALPGIAFTAQNSTGIYRTPTALGISFAGVAIATFSASAVTFNQAPTYAADPASGDQLTRKSYVDAAVAGVPIGNYLPLTGGTLAGPGHLTVSGNLAVLTGLILSGDAILGNAPTDQVTLNGNTANIPNGLAFTGGAPSWASDPASGNQLTRKSYVDAKVAAVPLGNYLPLIGGTLAGPGNLTVSGSLATLNGANISGERPLNIGVSGIVLGTNVGTPDVVHVFTGGAADAKLWSTIADTSMRFRIINDAQNAAIDWLTASRSGLSVPTVSFPVSSVVIAGNVGIGTNGPPPTTRLVSRVSANALDIISVVHNDNPVSPVAAIGFSVAAVGAGDAVVAKAGIGLLRTGVQGTGPLIFYNRATGDTSPFVSADAKMRLTPTGEFLINSTITGTKFGVTTSNPGGADVVGYLQNASNTLNTETRLGLAGNSNNPSDDRYAYIAAINSGGTNANDLILGTNAGGSGGTARVRVTSTGLVDILGGSGFLRMAGGITRFESAELPTPTAVSQTPANHGGPRVPDLYLVVLRCKVAEHGYVPGDEVIFKEDVVDINRSCDVKANATVVSLLYVPTPATGTAPAVRNATTGVYNAVTPANWRVVIKALWL
jgi:hypothetical protein